MNFHFLIYCFLYTKESQQHTKFCWFSIFPLNKPWGRGTMQPSAVIGYVYFINLNWHYNFRACVEYPHQSIRINTLSVFAKYELWWCMIFIQVIKYRNYILVTKCLHLIFLKYWVGHFFVKAVNKDDGDLSSNSAEQRVRTGFKLTYLVTLNLNVTLNYVSICSNLPVLNGRLPFLLEIVSRPPVWSLNLSFWGKHVQIFNFL